MFYFFYVWLIEVLISSSNLLRHLFFFYIEYVGYLGLCCWCLFQLDLSSLCCFIVVITRLFGLSTYVVGLFAYGVFDAGGFSCWYHVILFALNGFDAFEDMIGPFTSWRLIIMGILEVGYCFIFTFCIIVLSTSLGIFCLLVGVRNFYLSSDVGNFCKMG